MELPPGQPWVKNSLLLPTYGVNLAMGAEVGKLIKNKPKSNI